MLRGLESDQDSLLGTTIFTTLDMQMTVFIENGERKLQEFIQKVLKGSKKGLIIN